MLCASFAQYPSLTRRLFQINPCVNTSMAGLKRSLVFQVAYINTVLYVLVLSEVTLNKYFALALLSHTLQAAFERN